VRIGEDARRCVVFFGIQTLEGLRYGGTGVLLNWVEDDGTGTPYLVTCRHVARHLDVDFVIRANLVAGGSEEIPVASLDWDYHPDPSVDLAAAHFVLPSDKYALGYYPIRGAAKKTDVVCGDPISIVGLFRLHSGSKMNLPIVHSGTIALPANSEELVPCGDPPIQSEVYLVEAQTLDGLSGSPVFVQQFVTLNFVQTRSNTVPLAFGAVRLLGLYQGSWDGRPGEVLARDRNLKGDKVRVPVGLGLVIPSEKIEEMLMRAPKIVKEREDRKAKGQSFRAASNDSHAAARKPEPKN
jgi:hypothetical protein